MAQLGTIKVQTDSGIVDVPVFDVGDSGGSTSEALRVQTDSGIGFVPLVDPADASNPQEAIRVQTDSGVKAVTDSASLGPDNGLYLDGWKDDKLTNRDSYSTTSFEGTKPSSSNYTNPKRPEWTTRGSGTVTVSNSTIELPSGVTGDGAIITTPQTKSVGSNFTTWEITGAKNTVSSSGNVHFGLLVQTTNSFFGLPDRGYTLTLAYGEGLIEFKKVNTGETNLIRTTFSHSTSDVYKVERDSNGNFEVFVNGSSIGTASDTTYTTSSYTWISGYNLSDTLSIPEMRVF